jgi:hypothetical protein
MVPQERDLITTLLARLKGFAGQSKDPEADGLIRQAMVEQPDAPYYLVQTVLIQDLSLHQAQNRIAELEKQVTDAQAAPKPATSFLGNLFGTGQPASPVAGSVPSAGPWARGPQVAPAPPPQPGYAQPQQGYAPAGGGMMGGAGGGGFLRSAAATAAGIAGGALLFQGISSLFGHGYANSLTGGMGMTSGLGESVVNNYYGDSAAGSASGGADYGGGGDAGYAGGAADYGGGGDTAGGGDYSGGGDVGGGDFGGGGDPSC